MMRADARAAPPARDGVTASCIALPPGPWRTVGEFVGHRFAAVDTGEWAWRFAQGQVLGEGGETLPADAPYRPHTRIYYYRRLPAEPQLPLQEDVLYQDDHLVVADKPHFLPVTPGGRYLQETLLVRLRRRLGIDTLTPVHRLDRETAGLVVLCVRPDDRDRYHALFRERAVRKHYEAVAPWRADAAWPIVRRSRLAESPRSFMQMQEVAGEPNAHTAIEPLAQHGAMAHYRLTPLTGQRHQLRVHMAALGMPIANDLIYPVLQPDLPEGVLPDLARPLQLLARTLAFTDPVSGRAMEFESRRRLSGAVFGHDVADREGGCP